MSKALASLISLPLAQAGLGTVLAGRTAKVQLVLLQHQDYVMALYYFK